MSDTLNEMLKKIKGRKVNHLPKGEPKLRHWERYNATIICLANAHNRCATIDQLLECLEPINKASGTKYPVQATLNTLKRLHRRGMIRRSWVMVGRNKKKRLYCLTREVGSLG